MHPDHPIVTLARETMRETPIRGVVNTHRKRWRPIDGGGRSGVGGAQVWVAEGGGKGLEIFTRWPLDFDRRGCTLKAKHDAGNPRRGEPS